MVTRILSGYSIRGLIIYNEAKVETGDAQLILANKFGVEVEKLDVRSKLSRFERLTKLNDNAKRNALHIMLNFDRSDKLSIENLIGIATAYMDGIGFSDQPFLVYQHRDVSHPHLHIVTTNVKADGARIDFHNIGKSLSGSVRSKLEIDFGLTKALGKAASVEQKNNEIKIKPIIYGKKATKQSLYNVVTPVVRSYIFSSLAELNAVLQQFNVVADRGREDSVMFNRRGLVYSVVDANGLRIGVPIKASAFAGKPTLDRLEKRFAINRLKRTLYRDPLKKAIDAVIRKNSWLTKERYIKELETVNVEVVFRRSSEGRIFGVTYVDHNTKCVFNGSDLGKDYSARSLLEKLNHNDVVIGSSLVPTQSTFSRYQSNDVTNTSLQKSEASKVSELGAILFEKPEFEEVPGFLKRKKKKTQKREQSI